MTDREHPMVMSIEPRRLTDEQRRQLDRVIRESTRRASTPDQRQPRGILNRLALRPVDLVVLGFWLATVVAILLQAR